MLFVLAIAAFTAFDFKHSTNARNERAFQDSLEADRAKYTSLVRESIKGKENMRADSVFKNIQKLRIPAGRLLAIMNVAYSRSLGVSCGHFHNTSDFASEEKNQKEITRQMADMSRKINTELLKNIQGLKSETASINCTTCHRGELKPALDLFQK